MRICNMVLTEKQQKYQHYCWVNLINMNTLQKPLPTNRFNINNTNGDPKRFILLLT